MDQPINKDYPVYISYSWKNDNNPNLEDDVDRICQLMTEAGIYYKRDKDNLCPYRWNINQAELEIGEGNAIIVVISEKYIKSLHCMHEWHMIKENGKIWERVFPIVLPDAKITNKEKYKEYYKYYIDRRNDLIEQQSEMMIPLTTAESEASKHFYYVHDLEDMYQYLCDINTAKNIIREDDYKIIITQLKEHVAKIIAKQRNISQPKPQPETVQKTTPQPQTVQKNTPQPQTVQKPAQQPQPKQQPQQVQKTAPQPQPTQRPQQPVQKPTPHPQPTQRPQQPVQKPAPQPQPTQRPQQPVQKPTPQPQPTQRPQQPVQKPAPQPQTAQKPAPPPFAAKNTSVQQPHINQLTNRFAQPPAQRQMSNLANNTAPTFNRNQNFVNNNQEIVPPQQNKSVWKKLFRGILLTILVLFILFILLVLFG
ncbi:MAG: toll/interleukin-1 receptor domain-containing protein [Bacteroidales bacterium]|nr:toll/interleukin-1 receptor domain-containing protein [Bacteroidales bacterium]